MHELVLIDEFHGLVYLKRTHWSSDCRVRTEIWLVQKLHRILGNALVNYGWVDCQKAEGYEKATDDAKHGVLVIPSFTIEV